MSFVQHDENVLLNKNLRVLGDGPFVLEINGQIRTVVDDFTVDQSGYEDYTFNSTFNYRLCDKIGNNIGNNIYVELEDGNCVTIKNPAVSLEGHESSVSTILNFTDDMLQPIDRWWNNREDVVFMLGSSLFDNPAFSSICAALPSISDFTDEPIFARLSNGTWFLFDPRLSLDSNTPGSPISDGGKSLLALSDGKKYCSNAPRTFLNEGDCQLSSNACRQGSNDQIGILLENSTIAALTNLTGRYVYVIQGLFVKDSGIFLDHPCTPGLRSRWEPKDAGGCNPTELYSATSSALAGLILESTDPNLFIRDIYFPLEGTSCDTRDTEPEIEIEVDGQCWKRVHDEHMSIFDVSITAMTIFHLPPSLSISYPFRLRHR